MVIDLNCDMGESYGAAMIGNDESLMPLVSSANIACGFHGGDPVTIHRTVRLAQQYGVAIGAHPSFPDLAGFGRREMELSAQEVYDIIIYQIGALWAFTKAGGGRLHHVKPHGALYNLAAKNAETAQALVHAVYYTDSSLLLYGPPSSELARASKLVGIAYCNEVFADRTYQPDGSLTPRSQPNALIRDTVQAVGQVLQILENGRVTATDGTHVPLRADTICIHGDGLHAFEFASALRQALSEKGIDIKPPGQLL
jgi:UPF0271 protein